MTFTEENYLKAIYKISHIEGKKEVNTNSLAEQMQTKASSVTDMLKKLSEKELVNYEKYRGFSLTKKGEKVALFTIRKHRLWEVFLVDHLNFTWDEVHEIAEELEHINSEKLINNLDEFLGFPERDPHGDPIPNKNGTINHHKEFVLKDLKAGEKGIIVGVKEHSPSFLQYLDSQNIKLGTAIEMDNLFEFDGSVVVTFDGMVKTLSQMVSKNLYIKKIEN